MSKHSDKPRLLFRRIAVFMGNWLVMILGGRSFRTHYDESTLKKYNLGDDQKNSEKDKNECK